MPEVMNGELRWKEGIGCRGTLAGGGDPAVLGRRRRQIVVTTSEEQLVSRRALAEFRDRLGEERWKGNVARLVGRRLVVPAMVANK